MAESASITSRRNFLTVAASAAAILTPNIALPAAVSPDAELIDLERQIAVLVKQADVAEAECARCHATFDKMRSEKPRKLLWRMGDPVNHASGLGFRENGKLYLWCDTQEIEALRGKTDFRHWHFIGTDADMKAMDLHGWCGDNCKPVVGFEHLFKSYGDNGHKKRAKELLAALDEYNATEEAAGINSGYDAAEAECERIYAEQEKLLCRMQALKPQTIEGYRAMALAMVNTIWNGEIPEPKFGDRKIIAAIVSSLTGVPINRAAA